MTALVTRLRLLAIVACMALAPAAAADAIPAERPLPKLTGHVVDTAGALSTRAREGLDAELMSFRRETEYSIVLYIAGSLDGATIEDAAYKAFNTWKIGDAGKDNGILLLVAPTEHKIRIETGKGAGGTVTDLQANAIINRMGPMMARGEVEMAVTVGITDLEDLVRKEVVPNQPRAQVRPTSHDASSKWIAGVTIGGIVVVTILAIVYGQRRRTRRRTRGLLDEGEQKMKATGAALQVIGGVLRIIGAVAGSGRRSSGGGSKRRSGGGGGRSGGGGSSGSY